MQDGLSQSDSDIEIEIGPKPKHVNEVNIEESHDKINKNKDIRIVLTKDIVFLEMKKCRKTFRTREDGI